MFTPVHAVLSTFRGPTWAPITYFQRLHRWTLFRGRAPVPLSNLSDEAISPISLGSVSAALVYARSLFGILGKLCTLVATPRILLEPFRPFLTSKAEILQMHTQDAQYTIALSGYEPGVAF